MQLDSTLVNLRMIILKDTVSDNYIRIRFCSSYRNLRIMRNEKWEEKFKEDMWTGAGEGVGMMIVGLIASVILGIITAIFGGLFHRRIFRKKEDDYWK